MYQNDLKFRKDNKINTILQDFDFVEKDKALELYPRGYVGVDKIGRPVYLERAGLIKIKELLEITSEERMFQSYYHSFEELNKHKFLACSELYDRQVFQCLIIMDMKGLHMGLWNKVTTRFVKAATKISSDHYPEGMGKMLIVNAPWIFNGIYTLVKGWIDEK